MSGPRPLVHLVVRARVIAVSSLYAIAVTMNVIGVGVLGWMY